VIPAIGLALGASDRRQVPDLGLGGRPQLVFEPIVDLSTGDLLGFEGSLRRTDATAGPVATDAVTVRAAVEGRPAGALAGVLAEACSLAVTWPSDLQLVVDCTMFAVGRDEAATVAVATLDSRALDRVRLDVGVSETEVGGPEGRLGGGVSRLGLTMAPADAEPRRHSVDGGDAGTVTTLTIDGSVVAGLGSGDGSSEVIVATIVDVSRALGIVTVADAVETPDQVAILSGLGVGAGRGSFFSPPLTAADVREFSAMAPLPSFALTGASGAAPAPEVVASGPPTDLFADLPGPHGPVALDDAEVRLVGEALLELITAIERQNALIESWLAAASLPVNSA